MAWTDPTTRATGDLITASIWNTDLVNNLKQLRAIKGQVNGDGSIVVGSGYFTVSKTGTGVYEITFSTAFATTPSVVAAINTGTSVRTALPSNPSTTGVTIRTFDASATAADIAFQFVASVGSS